MVRFSSQGALLSLLLPFAIMCNLGICEMKASCNEKDKQILLCFKHGLTDPSGMLSTWSSKEDCCKWSQQEQNTMPDSYEGNPKLCGTPLIKKCYHDEALGDPKLMGNDEKGSELFEGFYMGMGVGFAINFWVVCGSIFFIRTWRHAYFKFLGDVKDQLYVKMILKCTPSVET